MSRSLFSLFAVACAVEAADTSNTDGSGGDSAADSGADDNGESCAVVTSGRDWSWSGECPQMPTPCDIVVTGCEMAIDYEADGGMTMGMPFSATIVDTTVAFADDNGVDGCVGTVESADLVTGSCKGGCTFKLRR